MLLLEGVLRGLNLLLYSFLVLGRNLLPFAERFFQGREFRVAGRRQRLPAAQLFVEDQEALAPGLEIVTRNLQTFLLFFRRRREFSQLAFPLRDVPGPGELLPEGRDLPLELLRPFLGNP